MTVIIGSVCPSAHFYLWDSVYRGIYPEMEHSTRPFVRAHTFISVIHPPRLVYLVVYSQRWNRVRVRLSDRAHTFISGIVYIVVYTFKSSTNRAPTKKTPGKLGEEFWVWLQLKVIADIGIIGMPNAVSLVY